MARSADLQVGTIIPPTRKSVLRKNMNQLAARPVPSRTTHLLAIATVVVALPLVLLGAEVTTKGVGMVDSVAVRSPWYFASEWMNDHGLGWLIEHGHRQVGWIVGILAIAT